MLLKVIISFILFLFCSSVGPGGTYTMPIKEATFRAEKTLFYLDIKNQEFSEELLKKCIYYEGIKYPDVVLLQAQLETGFYTSDIFNTGRNCFGMKFPKFRPTVSTGEYLGHAKYNNWWESVQDYKLWQDWYMSLGYQINTESDNTFYLVFLRCVRYAEDPKYIHKLVYLAQKDLT